MSSDIGGEEISLDIVEIMKYLPHRYPMILVDRVLSLKRGESISAIKNVTINEPFFSGHFPDYPIMPGVLLIEAMGQAGGILAYASWPKGKNAYPILLMGADKVRFRRKVVPGDQLLMEISILKLKSRTVKMRGLASVDGARAVEAEFMAVLGDQDM